MRQTEAGAAVSQQQRQGCMQDGYAPHMLSSMAIGIRDDGYAAALRPPASADAPLPPGGRDGSDFDPRTDASRIHRAACTKSTHTATVCEFLFRPSRLFVCNQMLTCTHPS